MNDVTALDYIVVGIWALAAILGVRSTFRVAKVYRAISPVLRPLARTMARVLVVVCFVITAAALYFGALATNRLAGNPPIMWSPFVSIVIATAVLLLPPYIDRVVQRIQRG